MKELKRNKRYNVGIRNVEPVIKSVLKHIVSIEVKELPQSTSLIRMFAEMKDLTCQQLAEELGKQEDLTLHSDGASKYGYILSALISAIAN